MHFLCTELSECFGIPVHTHLTLCRAGENPLTWPREAVNTSFGTGHGWAVFPGWSLARLGFSFPKLEAEGAVWSSAEAGRGSQALHRQHLGSRTGSPQPYPWQSEFGKRLSLLTRTPCSDAALERDLLQGLLRGVQAMHPAWD